MTKDPIPILTDRDIVRFWGKVRNSGSCWEWSGGRCGSNYRKGGGYGQFCKGSRVWYAHRVSWTIVNGKIPIGMQVLHHCDNPKCVRVDHLFLGTPLDNVNDCIKKGRCASGEKKANYGNKN